MKVLVYVGVTTAPAASLAAVAALALATLALMRAYLGLFAGPPHTGGAGLDLRPRERWALALAAGSILAGGLRPQPTIHWGDQVAVERLGGRALPVPADSARIEGPRMDARRDLPIHSGRARQGNPTLKASSAQFGAKIV